MDDEGWEARMAQRAAARRATREAERQVEDDDALVADGDRVIERLLADQAWLHGWSAKERGVVCMGNCSFCLGCGRLLGVFSIVLDESTPPPQRPDPDWPLARADCELCDIEWRRGFRWWL